MSWGQPKRFWDAVNIEPAEGGFAVLLDARPLRTPAKAALVVPNRDLAELVAQEWEAVESEVDPKIMRFTRSANAAIDKVSTQHGIVAKMLADYGGTDLLCYRATEPAELIARQMEAWDPLLDWADEALGARLVPTQGVLPIEQDAGALEALSARVHGFDAFELTAFHDLVSLSGSLILAFGVTEQRIDPEFAWAASRIDETFQEEQWGEDEDATILAKAKETDFHAAARLYFLLKQG